MIPTSNQLELDLFPEDGVTEGTLADWEEASDLDVYQGINHALQE